MPEPTPPNPAPIPAAPPQVPPGPPGTAFEAALKAAFPDGVIPSAQPQIGLQPLAPQFAGPTNPLPSPTPTPQPVDPQPSPSPTPQPVGVTGVSGPAAAPTGSTGTTGPAASGSATGPSGPPTKEQLDAAEKKMTMEAGTAFRIVRKEKDTLSKQLEATETKLQAAESKAAEAGTSSKEVTELREKVERYEKELAVTNYEATEQYQKTIGKPLATANAALTQLTTKYEVPAAELRAALAEPDAGKRTDLLSELSAKFNRLDTAAFDRVINDISNLESARSQALSTASEQLAQARAERERQATDASKSLEKEWGTARDKALEGLTADETAVGVLFKPTGDEKFDADVTAALEQVKTLDIAKLSNEEIAARFYRSQVLPLATRLISNQFARIEALTAEVAGLRGSTPPIGTGTPPQPTPLGTVPPNATFADMAKQRMAGVIPP